MKTRITTILLLVTGAAGVALAQTKLSNGPNIPTVTVSTLPAAASFPNTSLYVSDSLSGCTSGAGTNIVLCRSNGTSWVAVSGGGGSPASASFTVSGTGTSTLSISSTGNYYCNGVTTVVGGTTTTVTRSSGSPSGTLNIGVSCTDGGLKLITPTITMTCMNSGFASCVQVAASNFTPDVVPFASVALAGSTANFGAITDLRASNGVDPPTAGTGIVITTSGSTVTTAIDTTVVPQIIFAGTAALGTSSISSAACATAVTVSTTGVLTTDVIQWTPNASIKAVTGYAPTTGGGLSIAAYPTANNVNFDVCNWSSGSITPGAVTLNFKVVR